MNMILSDVYSDAIQMCTNAENLIIGTNEFHSNAVQSNGVLYTNQIHSCVIDGAFLTLFMALESFLEKSFICFMMGQSGLNGNSITRYVMPVDEKMAADMLKGNSRHTDFTNRDTVLQLAKNFFDGGGSYIYLNSIASDFEDMKKIRNAISHISEDSKSKFHSVVRNKLGVIPPNVSTADFLNTMASSGMTYFFHYKAIVIAAINNIANP